MKQKLTVCQNNGNRDQLHFQLEARIKTEMEAARNHIEQAQSENDNMRLAIQHIQHPQEE